MPHFIKTASQKIEAFKKRKKEKKRIKIKKAQNGEEIDILATSEQDSSNFLTLKQSIN